MLLVLLTNCTNCKQNSWKKIFKKKTEKKKKKKKKKKKTYFLEIQLKEGTYDLKNKNM